jgi:cyclopropane fatty-acyl-phospholipid synthase-like methyltransferase
MPDSILITVFEIVVILIVITAFAFLLTKWFRNLDKGGSSNTTTFFGATDAFLDTDKRKTAETIVEERAGKKMDEQSSNEPESKMIEFWDDRYNTDDYIYGMEPNEFFKEYIENNRPAKILLPSDGEGRNSVYAALKGWDVDAFDFSRNAVKKALELAEKNNVEINYYIDDLKYLDSNIKLYDTIALIFVHLTSEFRKTVHNKIIERLKPGGTVILEAFSKEQINNDSGGPKNLDMLYSIDELRKDFQSLEIEMLKHVTKDINEGKFHKGRSDVIRMIANKKT